MSRLARLHPYPAMIAEPLAEELAERFVRPHMRVLDPFCGTARTLMAAAQRGAVCTGIDVNPLAVLVARAKAAHVRSSRLRAIVGRLRTLKARAETFQLSPGRTVVWINAANRRQLCALIGAINKADVNRGELLLLAAALSATVREVSLARKNCWKLHRLPRAKRRTVRLDAIVVFRRRLEAVIEELCRDKERVTVDVAIGDSRYLDQVLAKRTSRGPFDLVITSPPYGDSVSTVQYGGMSGLCLAVLQYVRGLDIPTRSSAQIDRSCLGGSNAGVDTQTDLRRYWAGGTRNRARRRVAGFLVDMRACCLQIAHSLGRQGIAVFVIGKRRVGGRVLMLDRFLVDVFKAHRVQLNAFLVRKIRGKLIPYNVSSTGVRVTRARCATPVVTMREELVMVFSRDDDWPRLDRIAAVAEMITQR